MVCYGCGFMNCSETSAHPLLYRPFTDSNLEAEISQALPGLPPSLLALCIYVNTHYHHIYFLTIWSVLLPWTTTLFFRFDLSFFAAQVMESCPNL